MEDIKSLCAHVVENYGKILEDVEYVQTFKALKTRYDQHQDKLKERDRGETTCNYTFLYLLDCKVLHAIIAYYNSKSIMSCLETSTIDRRAVLLTVSEGTFKRIVLGSVD